MDYPRIENAKITSTSISMADHGCLVISFSIEGCGWGCSVGGWRNGVGSLGAKTWKGWGSAVVAMMKIMDTVGVYRWEDLKGKLIRVEIPGPGACSIYKIGNVIEDKWFDLKDFYAHDTSKPFVLDETPPSPFEDDPYDTEDGMADYRGRGGF